MDNLTCAQCVELLSAQLDNIISSEEAQTLKAHLAQCPECRQLARDLNQLHNAFAEIQEAPVPAGLVQSVMDHIAKPRRRRQAFKALAGLAACAVICVGLYGTAQIRPFPEPPVAQAAVSTCSEAAPAGGEATIQGIAPRVAAAPEAAPAQENDQADKAATAPARLLILDAMPDGAGDLYPPETAVTHSTEDGSNAYSPLTQEQLEAVAESRLSGPGCGPSGTPWPNTGPSAVGSSWRCFHRSGRAAAPWS